MRRLLLILFTFHLSLITAFAQVGEFRKDLAIGVNGGYAMSNVSFMPKVPQGWQGGMTAGMTVRYTCEKYFKSICAVVAEVNYAQIGWKEDIMDMQDQAVPLHTDPTQNLRYSRQMNYIQMPILARLGWGRERSGFQAFFQVGPQFGLFLSDKIDTNFDVHDPAFDPTKPEYQYAGKRASHVAAQDTMAVENNMDYGIAVGLGMEYSHRRLGHFLVDARYYYGLGNMYGSTKRDYFGSSNFGNIVVKFTYLFDVIRTKNSKIK
ncbi:MAG: PorT family protein [Prevotella sp.]|nr:PorT family protein [Prevotella sp.]